MTYPAPRHGGWPAPNGVWGASRPGWRHTYPAPGARPYPRPAPRSSGCGAGCGAALAGCAVLVGLMMVAGAVFGGIVALFGDEPTTTTTSWASQTATSRASTQSATPRTTTRTPSTRPTPSRGHPTATAFTNDGYQVPAPGGAKAWIYPANRDEALSLTRANALYRQRSGEPVRCPYDPIAQREGITKEELLPSVNRFVDCLMGVWQPPMARARFTLSRPKVVVYTGETVTTPCGTVSRTEFAGYYCGADPTLYIPDAPRVYRNGDRLPTYELESLIAHEFAHHVQRETGIIGGRAYLMDQASSEDAALEVSRRLELQAQCLAGMGIRAAAYSLGLTDADRAALVRTWSGGGDTPGRPRTHGSPAHYGQWFAQGLGATDIATCNTFTVPASAVE